LARQKNDNVSRVGITPELDFPCDFIGERAQTGYHGARQAGQLREHSSLDMSTPEYFCNFLIPSFLFYVVNKN